MRHTSAQSSRQLVHQNQENFPVASLLIPHRYRGSILDFYRFAREADDIADSPSLPADTKMAQLTAVDIALGKHSAYETLPDWAKPYARRLEKGESQAIHGHNLLSAFLQDAVQEEYKDWPALYDYCVRSAATVGRTVLEICQEEQADTAASDALCIALQLLNHTQDIREDYLLRRRIYLPQDWMNEAAFDQSLLAEQETTLPLRRVIDRLLDEIDILLQKAGSLPASIHHSGLRMETAVILYLARTLSARLRRQDPLAQKVRLPLWQRSWCFLRGINQYWRR